MNFSNLVKPLRAKWYDKIDSGTWTGDELILQAGACLVRADAALIDYPKEAVRYNKHVFSWIFQKTKFDDYKDQLTAAFEYCSDKDPDFIVTTSEVNGLWNTLKTDFMTCLVVMES